jgi:hypothetical protein
VQEQNYKAVAHSRLTDRHRNDETFLAILDTLIELKEQRQKEFLQIAETFLDIDKSSGKNLDLIGKLIGEERTLVNFIDRVYFGFLGARLAEAYDFGYWYSLYKNKYGTLRTLTDDEYRRVLKARVVKNSSDSNRNTFLTVVNILSNNQSTIVTEGLNNTAISVEVEDYDGLVSYFLSKYKNDRNLIPIPLGRRLNVTYKDINVKFFGFDGEEFTDNYGFGVGRFFDTKVIYEDIIFGFDGEEFTDNYGLDVGRFIDIKQE